MWGDGKALHVSDFGAKPDGSDAGPGIRAAIATALLSNSPVVDFAAGEYTLASGADSLYGISVDNCAGLALRGAGKALTSLRMADGTNRGVLSVANSSGIILRGLAFDGNRQNNSGGVHALRIEATHDVVIDDFASLNSGCYGIGFQGGNYQNVLINDFLIRESWEDGIDIKNDGSLNSGIRISNGLVIDAGADPAATAPTSIDIRAPGTVITNVQCAVTQTGRKTGGIRLRQDDAVQGAGGKYSTVSNCHVSGVAGLTGSGAGFYLAGPGVTVANCTTQGYSAAAGFYITTDADDCLLVNCLAVGGQIGFRPNADRVSFTNCRAIGNSGEGFRIDAAANCSFVNCFAEGNGYGFRHVSSSTGSAFSGCRATGNTTDWSISAGSYRMAQSNHGAALDLYAGDAIAAQLGYVSGATNFLQLLPSVGSRVYLKAVGASTDIDLELGPKGAGVVRFGAHSAIGAETVTGFISVKDVGGTVRKLAVVS